MKLQPSQKSLLREALIAWLILMSACRLFTSLQSVDAIRNNLSVITAVFLLYVPIGVALIRKEKISYFNFSTSSFLKSIGLGILTSFLVLLPALGINHLYQTWIGHHSFHLSPFPRFASYFFFELVVVALPEEFFFRGYLLERANQIFGKSFKLLGTHIGLGLPVVSLIFAISHSLIQYQWWHLLIFFPALLFGWLREKTGTITASVFFHATCNLFAQWVFLNYK